ncbi:MAG: MotA/TolQ/ExbB proton channel family protein [Phycisphaeraceae bacterium]
MTTHTPLTIQSFVPRLFAIAMLLFAPVAFGQSGEAGVGSERDAKVKAFNETSKSIEQRLIDSEAELNALIKSITDEKLPLNTQLLKLEDDLTEARKELERISKTAASRALEENKLEETIEKRKDAAGFIANRMDEYIREFEAGLHIAELQRFDEPLENAKNAMENRDLASRDRFDVQSAVITASLDRLEELAGGVTYQGSAIDGAGVLGQQGASVAGTFTQFGPVVIFSDMTGELQGSVVQKVGALLPEVVPFTMPEDTAAVKALTESGAGVLPLDATLGEAVTVERIEEGDVFDEIEQGGPVMYPILGLAAATLLVGLYKWLAITITPSPSRKKIGELLHAIATRNKEKAVRVAGSIRGPSGKMLLAGAEHMDEPRELIEEVMYEKVLMARLKVQRMLPFIAICAAAAPLLGLLGTVSGIINTFKMMQISGGADMQNVSGGISEALITTKFGLIVAIPALLMHVYLSRKAKRVVDQMEKCGVAFINQVMKTPPSGDGDQTPATPMPSPDNDTPPTDQTPDKPEGSLSSEAESPDDGLDSTQILPAEDGEEATKKEKEPALVESAAGSIASEGESDR